MTAYKREKLLQNTYESFRQYEGKEFDVFIDRDEDPKDYYNTCVPYNRVIRKSLESNPDIVIIQNAECFHAGDIIGYAEKNLTDKNYISFGCYSLSELDTLPPEKLNNKGASYNGESAWYNHPIFRPVGYHFCTAITAENLRKLNGFDERSAYGIAYEDNIFLHQVRNLGLKVEIVCTPFVFHQWHYSSCDRDPFLIKKNADLWAELSQNKEYRAVHLITPDL